LTVAANLFPGPGQGGTGPLPADAARGGTAAAATGEPWPAWLDTDTFDGLGEEAWLASLAEQEPEPADPADAELEWAEPEFESAGPGELPDDDLIQDVTEIPTSLCARLYGRAAADCAARVVATLTGDQP
jgi:hypothetical protein